VSVVANVAINVDSRNAVSNLRQVQQGAQATSQAVDKLNATNDALAASFTKSGKPIQTAANGMRYFVDATGRARKENGQFVTTAEAAAAGLQKQGKAAQQAGASVSNFGSTIRGLIGSFAAIQAAKFVFVNAAEIETQTRSLQVLTGSTEKAGQIVKELQDLGAVTPFTSSELIDAAKRLQAFGVETNKVVETTRRLADVSGATGAELQGLVTAYGQVQAKGRLQGEELLQFQERGVALQQVLREEYNLSGEEFQDALEKGRISAQAVEYAIQKLTAAGGKYADGAVAQSDTLAGRLSTLQDAVQNLASRLGSILAPAMQSILGLAIDIANQVNNVFETILLQRQLGANLSNQQRDRLFRQAGQEAEQIAKLRGGGRINADQFTQLREERFRDLMRTYGYQQGILKPPTATPPAAAAMLPGLMAATGGKGRGGKSDAEKAAEKAAREAEKLRQELERSLEVGDQLGTQFSRQAALLFEGSEIERKRLQIQFDFEDRAKQISELKNAEQQTNLNQLNTEIQRLELIDLQTEALKKQAEEADKLFKKAMEGSEFGVAGEGTVASGLSDAIAKLKEDLNPIKLQIDTIVNGATAIGDAFSAAFGEVITGAKSTQEALADAFKSIGQAFISMALEIIAKQMTLIILQTIFNALSGSGNALGTANKNLTGTGALKSPIPGLKVGGYAEGGFVTGPTNALIGEGGEPEYVIPASKMRTAMGRYSAGARGSSVVSGNGGPASSENGGGVATMEPIDVRYSIERINNVDYVTADQFQRGMAQAAQQGAIQGERRAMRSLKNSASTRRGVGI
jgi:tape measure domain-containing protein